MKINISIISKMSRLTKDFISHTLTT